MGDTVKSVIRWGELISCGERPDNDCSEFGDFRIGFSSKVFVSSSSTEIPVSFETKRTTFGKPLFTAKFDGDEGEETMTSLYISTLANNLHRKFKGDRTKKLGNKYTGICLV